MPNCDFYAFEEDFSSVVDFVFAQPDWELHELSSAPDCPVRVFASARDLQAACDPGRRSCYFQLYSPEMAGQPLHRRITLNPGAVAGATHRYCTEGWGLIQLYFGFMKTGAGLTNSHTNHNSRAGAQKWAACSASLGDPGDWDWDGVARVSGRLVRFVRKRSVRKLGSRPVLPGADRVARAGAELLLNG